MRIIFSAKLMLAAMIPKDSDVNGSNGKGTTSVFNISPGEHDRDADVGIYKSARIGNRVWVDANRDGVQGVEEEGIENVLVELVDMRDSVCVKSRTDDQGLYALGDIAMGDYYVRFTPPFGYRFTRPNRTSDDMDSDVEGRYGYGTTGALLMYPGDDKMHLDAGIYEDFALAVDVIDFGVQLKGNQVAISWLLADESNVEKYVVERKSNSLNEYEAVLKINVDQGSVIKNEHYLVWNQLNSPDIYHYRLRIIEKNGEENLSKTKMVQFLSEEFSLQIGPNPAMDFIDIFAFDQDGGELKVQFWDMVGKLQHGETILLETGRFNRSRIDVHTWPQGPYIVKVMKNGQIAEQRIVTVIR